MYGAMIGDIIGSAYESTGIKTKCFLLFPMNTSFTDDSIMTVAVAQALMKWNKEKEELHDAMIRNMGRYGCKYPDPPGEYDRKFQGWLEAYGRTSFNSCSNGGAMRVSPCGLLATSLDEALELARIATEVSHNTNEAIKGAMAVAAAVYLAKTGSSKEEIRQYIHDEFYPMDRTLDEIRLTYQYDKSSQGSVPQAILAFLESRNYEDAIRNAVSLGGDANTMATIAGSIAWSYYRYRNRGEMTVDMRKLRGQAEKYIPKEFADTANKFKVFCWKNAKRTEQTGKAFTYTIQTQFEQEQKNEEYVQFPAWDF